MKQVLAQYFGPSTVFLAVPLSVSKTLVFGTIAYEANELHFLGLFAHAKAVKEETAMYYIRPNSVYYMAMFTSAKGVLRKKERVYYIGM